MQITVSHRGKQAMLSSINDCRFQYLSYYSAILAVHVSAFSHKASTRQLAMSLLTGHGRPVCMSKAASAGYRLLGLYKTIYAAQSALCSELVIMHTHQTAPDGCFSSLFWQHWHVVRCRTTSLQCMVLHNPCCTFGACCLSTNRCQNILVLAFSAVAECYPQATRECILWGVLVQTCTATMQDSISRC